MAATYAYGDMRLARSLVRPGKVELHLYDYAPTPSRGGWGYVDEFDDADEALAYARDLDPEARVWRDDLGPDAG